ncbi:MAG TPA: ribonuclease J [Thermoflexales bacterium]|nr:ribonuclease J [Anaerolineae bacterium]HQV28101.1 ribonuclease J [Thermoflexales bacterium]HQX09993.1 ribonuclease J [Thermoflexales bacterium]HQY26744.1 ribonuclease J [Thermoflexales bacterium]HQZ52596.1 ribonuclease J [Thermoflexales bacterium]
MATQAMKWTPIGGLGEVGKNMMALEYNNNILIIDTGIMFPESDMHGIDSVIPDYGFLSDRRDQVKGIVITHGHEDHIGAIEFVVKDFPGVPIYATPLTKGLIENKLREAKLMDRTTVTSVATDATFNVGPFKVEMFRMCHSIPDNCGIGVTTPAGLIVHSGDFKFDHSPVDGETSDFAKLAEFSARGVLALFSDSTNAEVPGITPSEREIEPALEHVFRDAPGRIFVATFASLISRVQQVINVCEIYGRKLAVAGASMTDNVRLAQKMGYLNVPEGLLVRLEDALKMPPQEVAFMATGTQGEPTAALGRIATGKHPQITAQPGDTFVLSAHPIPGNEEYVHRIINRLYQKGATVVTTAHSKVHVSGHACQEEQKLLMSLVKPKFFVPIHGELRMLHAHRRLALDVGIPAENIFIGENGTPIEFVDGQAKQIERVPGSYIYVDGNTVGEIGQAVLNDRASLARDGFVIVVVRRNEEGGLAGKPELISRGFTYATDTKDLLDRIAQTAAEGLSGINGGSAASTIRDKAAELVQRAISSQTRRKPMVMAVVV